MSQTDEDKIINAKFLQDQKKKNIDSKNSSSGFHSFFRWLKKDERNHRSTYTAEQYKNASCESVYSTATTGFSFFPPNYYSNSQPEKIITPGPYTDSYKRRIRERDRARQLDKQFELTLRKKYKLFTVLRNSQKTINNISVNNKSENDSDSIDENRITYSELSLPNKKSHDFEDQNNNLDEGESTKKQRRTVSESSRFLKAGAYVHVKGKRKAPPPPSPPTTKLLGESSSCQSNVNTLSPNGTLRSTSATLRRKKGLAPPPPSPPIIESTIINYNNKNHFPESISTTSLFDDVDIRAIIGDVSSFLPPTQSINDISNSGSLPDPNLIPSIEQTVDDQELPSIVLDPTDVNENAIIESNIKETMTSTNENEGPSIEPTEKIETHAPLSRPWYKRSNNSDSSIPFKRDVVLKTMDKRKNKSKKQDSSSTPNSSTSTTRKSFFDNGPKFNFFFKSNEHKESIRKKERENDVRKSGIKIPNISELDREASEILSKDYKAKQMKLEQQNEEYYKLPEDQWILKSNWFLTQTDMFENNDDVNPRRQSTKDLISKFESSSNNSKIKINPSYLNGLILENEGTKTKVANSNDSDDSKTDMSKTNQNDVKVNLETNASLKENDTSNNIDIKSETWKCSNCTYENQSWRIICEICEKIKPIDVRALPEAIEEKRTGLPEHKPDYRLKKQKSEDQEKKTEQVLKYFFPKQKNYPLGKSSSETVVNKIKTNLESSNPKDTESHNDNKSVSNNIKLSPDIKNRNLDKKIEMTKNIIHENEVSQLPIITDQNSLEKEKIRLRQLIRDMNAKALAKKYPVSPKVENSVNESNNNLNMNNLQNNLIISNNNNLNINISSGIHSKTEKESSNTDNNNAIVSSSNNLGAIKKKPLIKETISVEHHKLERNGVSYDKNGMSTDVYNNSSIHNNDIIIPATVSELCDLPKSSLTNEFLKAFPPKDIPKSPKMGVLSKTYLMNDVPKPYTLNNLPNLSTDFLTTTSVMRIPKTNIFSDLPTPFNSKPIYDIQPKCNFINLEPMDPNDVKIKNVSTATNDHHDKSQVEEITKQLRSDNNLMDFKASLKFPAHSLTRKESITLNKLIKDLENAIFEGRHNLAANLAIELAKMRVSLSVTRHKNKRHSSIDDIIISLFIEDKISLKGPYQMTLSPLLNVFELKNRILQDYQIPVDYQKLVINNQIVCDDKKTLFDLNVCELNTNIYLYLVSPEVKKVNENVKALDQNIETKEKKDIFSDAEAHILSVTDSDDELSDVQNENSMEEIEGAAAAPATMIQKPEIDDTDGCWTCPLCTLINSNYRSGCLACSAAKPHLQEDTNNNNDSETDYSIIRQPKNNLNLTKANRKSTDFFNIIEDETKAMTKDQHNLMIYTIENIRSAINLRNTETQSQFLSPNITKNKYRGVDNFNPNTGYVLPKVEKGNTTTNIIPKTITPVLPKMKYKHNKVNMKMTQQGNSQLPDKTQPVENHYTELLNLDTTDAISNMEPFECPICFVEYEKGNGIILRDCLHIFCKECLVNTIQYNDEAVVKCPYANEEYSCESLLQEREIKFLVSQDIYEKHLSKSIQQAELKIKNAFHCKTPNCRGWCIYEDNVNQFTCPVCRIKNCLTCQVVHDGLNCKQFQDQMNNNCDNNVEARRTKEKLNEMVEKGEAMSCPTCQVIMMKKWGCDWLKCTMCKTEICWITRGPRWGPNGKGDTTGGCKCGVDGKKCHPKCNYCH